MKRFKIQEYYEEFPFLLNIIGNDNPDDIDIKQADEKLLQTTPEYYFHNGSCGITEKSTKIHFILNNGDIIKNAVEQQGSSSSNYSDIESREWDGETILESIDRHDVAKTLKFIVVEDYFLNNWTGSEVEESYTIGVYEIPSHVKVRVYNKKTGKYLVES